MLLPSGHTVRNDPSTVGVGLEALGPNCWDISRHLDILQDTLKDGWTIHTGKDGRLYYCNHITRTAGWLPPNENWPQHNELPYGWEKAVDPKGRSYFINHLNKTTTYEAPDWIRWDSTPPEPRVAVLQRSSTVGFGFVAGSERPVIVRFVTEGGPSVNKLQPGDQILAVNGKDVKEAPRDHVIQLVRSCESQVSLLVCQPASNAGPGRKSTLLSAGKRAKLRTRPSRVRFAESVCVNGAPLFPPSAFSLGDLCVPPMANVLKVFLENGQTKSFKYDATTTVHDVVSSLRDKLCINAVEHFSLVLEHVKSLKRNKLTLLDADETLARIAARPGAHKLRCLFRVTFVPVSAAELAQRDLNSLDYLYMQCCNDVTQERFAPELQPDVALRLAALHMHQHALANNVSPAKLTVKVVEREFGLERFVPSSLIEGMKRKELRRLIAHFLKLNSQMTGSSSKMLTQLQAKIHYLDIISGLPSYGAKCFSTNQRDGVERVLLISPRFGLSQIAGIRNSVPQPISALQDLARVTVHREDDVTNAVTVQMQNERIIKFSMEDRDACEFSLVLSGYYRLLTGRELVVEREREPVEEDDNAPSFLAEHTVLPATWSYLLPYHNRAHTMNFLMPPSYHSLENITSAKNENESDNNCDRNMNNNAMPNHNHRNKLLSCDSDEFGYDIHSVMAMELLENAKDNTVMNGVIEARNEEVLRRVAEMQRMVESSEQYLNEHGELIHEYEMKSNCRQPWSSTSIDLDSDCESLNSSKVSSNEDAPAPGALKHSDSLVLLAEAISQDLSGITKGLNSINTSLSGDLESGPEGIDLLIPTQQTALSQRKMNGLSQLLNDLQSLGNDCSQSESDSESVHTPSTSPTHKRTNDRQNDTRRPKKNAIRTSFGLHSPDSSVLVGPDAKEHNLKDYLRQLKELSNVKDAERDNDFETAQKLSELYGFEIGDDTFIETDPDLIDLRAIPPPPTPDELDALSLLNAAPRGFDDSSKVGEDFGDLDRFLAKVIVAPPTQKATPAKELTPEEIMSFIIPPPPSLENAEKNKDSKKATVPTDLSSYEQYFEESLYSNSNGNSKLESSNQEAFQNSGAGPHVIDYPTVERKGTFSCCSKTKKDVTNTTAESAELKLPPRKCLHIGNPSPPARPPKSLELQNKLNTSPSNRLYSTIDKKSENHTINSSVEPPTLPPRGAGEDNLGISPRPVVTIPPKKLPPIAIRPILRTGHPSPKLMMGDSSSPTKVAGIGSPHLHRNLSLYREIDKAFTSSSSPPVPMPRSNGHARSNSDCPPVCLKNPSQEQRPQLSLLCSPQFARKNSAGHVEDIVSSSNNRNNGFNVINGEALLAKTDIAMAGLLVKLDQVAAQCSAAQAAGGGANIDEAKFQRARDELTEQALTLVTSSKMLVVAMSDATLSSLPEHLTSCLTSIRRITELTQDMTRHTSSPLQTRNIVLKVHDVAASFRELAGVQIGPLGAGQLALQAECLANVLATLLRSLRVFSP